MKSSGVGGNTNQNQEQSRPAFALLQGHRFLWWRSVEDFDDGCEPLGSLNLSGHAGLTNPSPLELMEMKATATDVSRLVCIFGRGAGKQERITILTPTMQSKTSLEHAVEDAVTKKQD